MSGAFPGHPRRPKIDPRRLQDDLQDLLFSTSFLSSILVRLGSDFGSIWAPSWPPFGSQNLHKCRGSADPVELKTTLTTHDGPRRPQEAPKTPQELPKSLPRPPRSSQERPKDPPKDSQTHPKRLNIDPRPFQNIKNLMLSYDQNLMHSLYSSLIVAFFSRPAQKD